MKEYQAVLTKYFIFKGRSSRREYWMFFLFNMIFSFGVEVVARIIGIPMLVGLYSLILFIPGLAVGVRRLHDIGKSGFWYFILLVPLVGWIVFIVFLATAGSKEPNQYGDAPTE